MHTCVVAGETPRFELLYFIYLVTLTHSYGSLIPDQDSAHEAL